MTDSTITFYDIPCKQGVTWSPNTWKTRYSLNFKGLPYKIVWVEYPDIEPLCKKIGAKPTSTKDDGRPHYTLPVIHDPTTGVVISESALIAEYLDKTYPDKKPALIPAHTHALQAAFRAVFSTKLDALWQFALPKTTWALNPVSEEYFRRTRLLRFGVTMEELFPSGEKAKVEWKKFEEALGSMDKWMRKEDVFMMGDTPSFADIMIASFLMWVKILFGAESEEWKDIESWHEGRWSRLLKDLEKYEGAA